MTNEKGEANVKHFEANAIGRQIRARSQAISIDLEVSRLIARNNPGLCGVLQRVIKMLREVGTQSGHEPEG